MIDINQGACFLKNDNSIIRLSHGHVRRACKVLSRSFQDDPEASVIFPDRADRRKKLRHIFEFATRYAIRYGEGYAVGKDLTGIALWLPSAHTSISPVKVLRTGILKLCRKIGLRAVSRLFRLLSAAESRQKKLNSDRHWLLFLLGVSPDHRKKGHAGMMINKMIEKLDAERLPCRLDTYNENNVSIYQKFGFELVDSSPVHRSSLRIFSMRRPCPE